MSRLKDPWKLMLFADALIGFALIAYKLRFDFPAMQYAHLLVSYDLGFAKRALVGAVLSLFLDKVPLSAVQVLGLAVWLLTLVLYIVLFRRDFGRDRAALPLFVFMAGSPFFFKNFLYAIGYFDIYGCLFAILALLLPVNALYPFVVAAGCAILILIHHIHIVLYVPTIGFIAAVRYYCLAGPTPARRNLGFALAGALGLFAVFVQFRGAMPVPPEELLRYVERRAATSLDPVLFEPWYRPLGEEIYRTTFAFFRRLPRVPFYLAIMAIHLPVIRYFCALIEALREQAHKTIVAWGLVGILLGYLVVVTVANDDARWMSGFVVCMFLAMHAVRLLPSSGGAEPALVSIGRKQNLLLAWAVTLIPRIGISKPF